MYSLIEGAEGTSISKPTVKLPDYSPSERQTKFHSSLAFETLYGGAAGGGKTAALCAEAITSAIEESGTHVYIFRRTLQDLRRSVFNEIMRQVARYQNLPDYQKVIMPNGKRLIITYNNQESAFKFSNDSFIQFAYLDTVADRYRYQSAEIHILLIDELTHFLQDDYEYLKTRVRSADDRRLRIMCATNPGNIGHGWVRDYFIESKDPEIHRIPEELWLDPNTELTRIFIPAKLDDHPNARFRETYGRVLDAIPDENLKAALRDGDWHRFEGQIYTEWDKDKHVISKLPDGLKLADCEKYIGFDWGYNDYACATFLAVAPENEVGVKHVYAYREVYDRQKSPTWWGKEIREYMDHETIDYMILPHDCFSHLGGNQTIARTFSDFDIPHLRANSQSHAAKMHRMALMHQLLSTSEDGTPYLQFLDVCANNIRTIPDLPYSETKAEEVSEKAEDHAFDATTYGLMVILDGETWIVNEGQDKSKRRESFVINEYGEPEGLYVDVHKILERSQQVDQDWKTL